MTTATDPAIRAPELPLGRLECDAFCTCGYNLYRQPVVMDDRLNLPLIRCPECGQWHPAGHGATAASVWMTRLAKVLLVAWIILLLIAAAITVLIQMGFNMYAHEEVFRARGYYGYGTRGESYSRFLFFVFPASLGVFAGLVQSVGMWHLSFLLRLIPIGLILGLAMLFSLGIIQSYSQSYRDLAVLSYLLTSGVTAAAWILTAAIGRAPARWLAQLLIPPGPRQYLAFLWLADGKQPPSANHSV